MTTTFKTKTVFDIECKVDGATFNFSITAENETEAKEKLLSLLEKIIFEIKQ